MGDESFAIHHEISISRNGSVQKAVKYLFDKSLVIGSSVVHSSGVMQSSITSGFFLSKHQESHKIPKMNIGINNGQIFFIFFITDKICFIYLNFQLKCNI
jgi:hypothetical protein